MELSIIITAYNTDKYITRCLDSVSDLELESYEIIVVDDGSTDETKQRVFEQNDSHIVYLYKSNGGIRSSRIAGLKKAKGKYIAFLDSDDWVDKGYYEFYVGVLENNKSISVCSSSISRDYPDGSMFEYHRFCDDMFLNQSEAVEKMVLGSEFKWELASKVYRCEVFECTLPTDSISICEDLDWNWVLFKRINKLFHSSKRKYHYCVNENSMTQRSGKALMTQDKVYYRILQDASLTNELRHFFLKEYIKMIPRHLLEEFSSSEPNKKEIVDYQESFRKNYCNLSKDCMINKEMKDAICDSYDSCKQFFTGNITRTKTSFEILNSTYNYIFIYGNGFIADYLSRWNNVYELRIDGYVVSDGQPIQRIYRGKKTWFLSEIEVDKEKCCFVIPLYKRIQKKIVEVLKQSGYSNHLCIDTTPFIDF